MKKLIRPLLNKTLVCALIITAGLCLTGLFGQVTTAAAQTPTPEEVAAPRSTPENAIIPNGLKVVANKLNLRQGPGTEFAIVNVLQAGDVLTITNLSPALDWIKIVTGDGQVGWVSALPEYVSLNTTLDEQSLALSPPVPILLENRSLDEAEFGLTEFTWQWDGQLAENQGFEVRVWREGEPPRGIHNAILDNKNGNIQRLDDHIYRLTVDIHEAPGVTGPGTYFWTVLLIETSPIYRELGLQAEPARLAETASYGYGYFMPPPIETGEEASVANNANYAVVKVFYGTDRRMTGFDDPDRYYGAVRGPLTYGVAEVSIPREHRLGELEAPSVWKFEFRQDPQKHVVLLSVNPSGDEEFFTDLRSRINASQQKQAFVFVHGFNVTFKDAARQTAQLAYDLGFDGAPILYSWPSNGTLIDYPADETDVEWSTPHLQAFLEDIATRTGAQVIHVIAHSMGNRALTRALANIVGDTGSETRALFHQIVLAAPDIDAEVFTEQLAPMLIAGYPRATLYASSRDKALLLSKLIHQWPRAGDIGENMVILEGLDTIDVSNVDISLLGHSYFAENKTVLADMFSLLNKGFPPAERSDLERMESARGIYWIVKQ